MSPRDCEKAPNDLEDTCPPRAEKTVRFVKEGISRYNEFDSSQPSNMSQNNKHGRLRADVSWSTEQPLILRGSEVVSQVYGN